MCRFWMEKASVPLEFKRLNSLRSLNRFENVPARRRYVWNAGVPAQKQLALITAALQPDVFSDVVVHEGMASLDYVLQTPVRIENAPELFCLDLYKEFDIDRLAAMAAPAVVSFDNTLETPQR